MSSFAAGGEAPPFEGVRNPLAARPGASKLIFDSRRSARRHRSNWEFECISLSRLTVDGGGADISEPQQPSLQLNSGSWNVQNSMGQSVLAEGVKVQLHQTTYRCYNNKLCHLYNVSH
jgi:hypothetical protein